MKKYSHPNENSSDIVKVEQIKNEGSKPIQSNYNNISHNNEVENESFDSDENIDESVYDSENQSESKK
jgi:hypothetical protein